MAIDPSDRSLKVLAVEDDPSVAHAISVVLDGPSCDLTTVSNATDALDTVNRDSVGFDVLVTDNSMPVVSGGELVRRPRGVGFSGKIIVLSAYVSPEEEIAYRALGVDTLLSKPFEISELRRAVGLEN